MTIRVRVSLNDVSFQGGPLVGLVNGGEASDALRPANKPWVALGEALGALLTPVLQSQSGKSCKLEIVTTGEVVSAHLQPFVP